jgi:hypothetical protein
METSLMIIAVPCADPMRDCLLLLSCLTAPLVGPSRKLLQPPCLPAGEPIPPGLEALCKPPQVSSLLGDKRVHCVATGCIVSPSFPAAPKMLAVTARHFNFCPLVLHLAWRHSKLPESTPLRYSLCGSSQVLSGYWLGATNNSCWQQGALCFRPPRLRQKDPRRCSSQSCFELALPHPHTHPHPHHHNISSTTPPPPPGLAPPLQAAVSQSLFVTLEPLRGPANPT